MVSKFAMCPALHLWDDLSHPIGDFMRYDKEHKAKTRTRIVKDAAQRFRSEGLTGASVATVMQDTGLTHVGSSKHFPSNSDLFLLSIGQASQETARWPTHVAAQ